MGLKKSTDKTDEPQDSVSFEALVELLNHGSMAEKRLAARDLADHPNGRSELILALQNETDVAVLEAILDSLQQHFDAQLANDLLDYLRSENVFVRNEVIGILQNYPDFVGPHILALLNDVDSDVRIFAVDILQLLAHPDTPQWLLSVIKDEQHINVVAAAVDRLAEVGTPEMIPELQALTERFPNQPYLSFAVKTAIHRIAEAS
ncbi:HEAT repeat domain-containing protein [Salinibius halmophilus]|uniref:HEAT repeat domain-containing protein n=1 Tax=Salinibius halmophilus TaxID=1853216 RepID=UPI000E673016|nr:HEAT repeat domain-containing protein [Salinibius halmophilus]